LAQIGGHQCRPNGLIPAVFPARRSYRCPDGAPAVIIGLSRERGEKHGEIEAKHGGYFCGLLKRKGGSPSLIASSGSGFMPGFLRWTPIDGVEDAAVNGVF
jgi:hypothetical protein